MDKETIPEPFSPEVLEACIDGLCGKDHQSMARRLLYLEPEVERLRLERAHDRWVADKAIEQGNNVRTDAAKWRELEPRLPILEAAKAIADNCVAQRDAPLYKTMTREERERLGLTAGRFDLLLDAYRAAHHAQADPLRNVRHDIACSIKGLPGEAVAAADRILAIEDIKAGLELLRKAQA